MEETCGAARVLILAEHTRLRPGAVSAACSGFNGRSVIVTVVAVKAPRQLVTQWAPLSGFTTLEEIDETDVADACDVARVSACEVTGDLSVRYRIARRWADALVLAGEHDLVILPAAPRRLRDRLRVSRAISSGMRAVVA